MGDSHFKHSAAPVQGHDGEGHCDTDKQGLRAAEAGSQPGLASRSQAQLQTCEASFASQVGREELKLPVRGW